MRRTRTREWLLERRADHFSRVSRGDTLSGKKNAFRLQSGDFEIECGHSGYDSWDGFEFRDVSMVARRDGKTVCVAKFREWRKRQGEFEGEDGFVQSADNTTEGDHQCALMIKQHWQEASHPLAVDKSLIILCRLYISNPGPGIWQALEAASKKAFAENGGVLVLKAFPLEWEGEGRKMRIEAEQQFQARLAAMRRHFRNRFGMIEIPHNDDGWMWKSLGGAKSPRKTKPPAASKPRVQPWHDVASGPGKYFY